MIRGALLVLTLALAGLLVFQWRDWPRPLPTTGTSSAKPDTATVDGGAAPDGPASRLALPESKETFASVAERPLFRPQRRPPDPPSVEPPAAPVPAEAGSLEGLDLSAVLISPGATMAWIKDPNAPDLKRLRPGDEHVGWSVKDILSDRLVLERQGETNELLLREFAKAQVTPPAGPTKAAPNAVPNPNPAAQQRQPQPPPRAPQPAQVPGGDPRVAPPRSPQLNPNVRRPLPQRSQQTPP
ncbi:MAG TPA: hypothetical protein VES73_15430 [Lamprocystis sp. (in: g-proteobacteria)]|nr:hypothetical protein [Lamprocystis sp. (in: g-proteobacteria)]